MSIHSLTHKPHHGEADPDDEPGQLPVEPDQDTWPATLSAEAEPSDTPIA